MPRFAPLSSPPCVGVEPVTARASSASLRPSYTNTNTASLRGSRMFRPTTASSSPSGGGAAGGAPGNSGGANSRNNRNRRRQGRARLPGQYEVKVITPPPKSLGIHSFEPNMGCGDQLEVEGAPYVVSSVVLRYKLEHGKYVRDHNRLEVQPTPRYFLNRMLDEIYEQSDDEKGPH